MSDRLLNNGFDQELSRYIVGIDLGTTNCAVAYIDTERIADGIQLFPIEQWVDIDLRERRELLPSFLYQPLAEEAAALQQHGERAPRVAGALARDRGQQLPGRQVASAKSWLCHDGVDRRAPILPWQHDAGVEKISPVDASAAYLAHIRNSWDRVHQRHPLTDQDIVLTLPASFDQVARQLTIEAAAAAEMPRILPIEEPQAAFYAWLARRADDWEQHVHAGQTILVCDIGGGTTDFTLIRVRTAGAATGEEETLGEQHRGRLSLHRVAVGQHLILGGDNIDLALAKFAEQKLTAGQTLPPRSWDALRQACRVAKEQLLSDEPPATFTIHLPGSGSRLVGGGKQVQITKQEVQACVLDGFFPACNLRDRPEPQQIGFQEFGLPYASDAAITRHLASFIWEHRRDGRSDEELEQLGDLAAAKPDWILFNGGVMASHQLRARIVDGVAGWFAGSDGMDAAWRPQVLEAESFATAVAKGAAYFGQVRRGSGVHIEAKLACSYYLQTSVDPAQAICIVPGSASPGDRFALDQRPFELTIGQPVQFPIAYSTTRLSDQVGEVVELDTEHFSTLPPIRTVLEVSGRRRRDSLPVFLEIELSQIGTMQMYCHAVEGDNRWRLEFDVRGSVQTDHSQGELLANRAGILDVQTESVARAVIAEAFGESGTLKPSALMKQLADALQLRKNQWPPHLLRSIWSALMDNEEGRRKSAAHEARWLNLLGYALRPGYGLAADDWRVAQSWRAVHGRLAFAAPSSRSESLILWRRIAGGFTAGQQLTVFQQIAGPLRAMLDPARRAKGGAAIAPAELAELLRLVGSLELLPQSEKLQLGEWLLALLPLKKWAASRSAMLWTVGRLGSRVPTYGPLNCVVHADDAAGWIRQLLQLDVADPALPLALMLCARRTHDRYRDIDDALRGMVLKRLEEIAAPEHYLMLVRQRGQLESEEASQVVGESLPLGLQLR